jgi:hypothetical protein
VRPPHQVGGLFTFARTLACQHERLQRRAQRPEGSDGRRAPFGGTPRGGERAVIVQIVDGAGPFPQARKNPAARGRAVSSSVSVCILEAAN